LKENEPTELGMVATTFKW